ncbi:alpha,alpha-trehalase TreF [Algiphilus sp. W345]|uniref:Alpha,alpha-trehalase TreF n=1 Tax=Banduia mediterranea TaxID=3075609 RepID=A0ABU2WI84_9GAMM|nr:alpha,alpha-trehalase TreF [Algiphilus sp. W345]MDT0497582.1 alpha,alpha-trehalase TreF [Algiphilus sp. W345]
MTPADRYQELFVAVQTTQVFADSKTFVDCFPKSDDAQILKAYRDERGEPGFDLPAFVHRWFDPPVVHRSDYVSDPSRTLADHIDSLWPALTRHPREHPRHSSYLPLPMSYVVPGGRFGELYYWDSFFTMLGFSGQRRPDLLRAMATNFAYLIDTYGHVPNGNRSYYLSRSQPPVFALMVEQFEEHEVHHALHYLPQLKKEYAYWMEGVESLAPGEANRRVVRLEDGSCLNRYWDDRDTPREEAYAEDLHTASQSPRPAQAVYRDLRAGAESGWDFSSRWLEQPDTLSSIRTTAILPVDLNCLLYRLEITIAKLEDLGGDSDEAHRYVVNAHARKKAIQQRMWNVQRKAFFDFDWQLDRPRECLTAATVVPLYLRFATVPQARDVAVTVRESLLEPGGLATTMVRSGQQWDVPNGWAPLQWMAVMGFSRYGEIELAESIASRWLRTVSRHYRHEAKLVEKYDIGAESEGGGGGGGEYPLQDGFGWTNGVTRRLLDLYGKYGADETSAEHSPPDRRAR